MKTLNLKNTVLLLICIFGFSISASAQKTTIQVNELPENAKSFIKQHFKNETVSYVIKEEEFLVIDEYKVALSDGTEIEFTKNGNWKEISNKTKGIKSSVIPNKILNYCTKSFPNTNIKKIEKSRWKYDVELSNDLDLEFDSDGNFKRIDD